MKQLEKLRDYFKECVYTDLQYKILHCEKKKFSYTELKDIEKIKTGVSALYYRPSYTTDWVQLADENNVQETIEAYNI